jgi:hypothetical protein
MLRALVVGIVTLVVASCGNAEPTAANAAAGKVLEVSGKVTATRGGSTRPLATSSEVFSDDLVDTGPDGSVVIELFHNNARWALEASLQSRVDQSVAWGLDKQQAAKLVEHATSSAGRSATRSAADTKESAVVKGAQQEDPSVNQSRDIPAVAAATPEEPQRAVPSATKTRGGEVKPPATKPVTIPDPKRDRGTVASSGCDEVDCIINNSSSACCARYRKSHTSKDGTPAAGDTPDKLGRAQIGEGIAKVKPRVMACSDKSAAKGNVKVAVVVSAGGVVSSVTIQSTPDAALGECVATALKTAAFAKSASATTFSYVFVF